MSSKVGSSMKCTSEARRVRRVVYVCVISPTSKVWYTFFLGCDSESECVKRKLESLTSRVLF